jgi:hypothetical protein
MSKDVTHYPDSESTKLDTDALKLLVDWSKWLLTLEAGVCTLLWSKLNLAPVCSKADPPVCSFPAVSRPLFAGWMFFVGSIVCASILMVLIPFLLSRKGVSERDMNKIWVLVAGEYACFLTGCVCLAWQVYKSFH